MVSAEPAQAKYDSHLELSRLQKGGVGNALCDRVQIVAHFPERETAMNAGQRI
jgi:hypothetical protein